MAQPSHGRPTTLAAGALLALAVLALAPGSLARAACGHDTLSSADRANREALAGMEALSPGAVVPDLSDASPARKPCSGPSCSDRRSQPVAPAPAGPERVDRWLWASALFAPPAPAGRSTLPQDAPARPVNRPDSLERPPRSLPA